jgi:hypothetical protein
MKGTGRAPSFNRIEIFRCRGASNALLHGCIRRWQRVQRTKKLCSGLNNRYRNWSFTEAVCPGQRSPGRVLHVLKRKGGFGLTKDG